MSYKGFGPSTTSLEGIDVEGIPSLQEQPVQSVITLPTAGTTVHPGDVVSLQGYAYSGGGRGIVRVDVSVDGGKSWKTAELGAGKQQVSCVSVCVHVCVVISSSLAFTSHTNPHLKHIHTYSYYLLLLLPTTPTTAAAHGPGVGMDVVGDRCGAPRRPTHRAAIALHLQGHGCILQCAAGLCGGHMELARNQ